jgi:hypothetical protein
LPALRIDPLTAIVVANESRIHCIVKNPRCS